MHPYNMNNSNKIQDTKTSSQISKKMILSILEDGSKLPQEILLKLKLSKKYRSSLSYHLGGLVDNGFTLS